MAEASWLAWTVAAIIASMNWAAVSSEGVAAPAPVAARAG
ncbi:hypothetical protein QFZ33_004753 [Arthrobacter globiformis]|nr:hypothetical protein [Arthrobacter globiformis]